MEAGVPDGFLLHPAGEGLRSGWILWINSCLCCWCQQQGFDVYDRWTLLQDQELLRRDGIHLTKCGKSIFTNMLANLLRRTLKMMGNGDDPQLRKKVVDGNGKQRVRDGHHRNVIR